MNSFSLPRLTTLALTMALCCYAVPSFAQTPSLMEPHRAGRIRMACADATANDFQHVALGLALVGVGIGLYLPSVVEDPSIRPPIGSFQRGMALGLAVTGAVLALRPYGSGGVRIVETCERVMGADRDNPVILRDAERYLNAVAISQRTYALGATLAGAIVGFGGAAIAFALFNDTRQQLFWIGAFLSVPLVVWLDMLIPASPLRAALRFHRNYYRAPRIVANVSMSPVPNGMGAVLSGSF